jgi:tetratricopeptide (TPR) repeat protein
LERQAKKVLATQGLEAERAFIWQHGVHGTNEVFSTLAFLPLIDADIRLGRIDEAYRLLADKIRSGSRNDEVLLRASAVACMKGELYDGQEGFVRHQRSSEYELEGVRSSTFIRLPARKQTLVDSLTAIAIYEDGKENRDLAAFYYKKALDIDPDNTECVIGFAKCIRADDIQSRDKEYDFWFFYNSPEQNRRFALQNLARVRPRTSGVSRVVTDNLIRYLKTAPTVLGAKRPVTP